MLEFLSLKLEAFGIDISDLSFKIIKLKKRGKFLSLSSFGETKIGPDIIEAGEIKNETALAQLIKEAILKVKGEKIGTKYVVASLPEEKTFLQVIQMPILKEEELKKAIYFEAENYIPIPIEQVYLDVQIITPSLNHLDHIDVLIAALPKKTVDSYVSTLKKAGLVPLALEIESQAISRALVKNGAIPSPLLLIDFGATRTSFIIFSGRSLRYTSSIPVASQKLTEAISRSLGVDSKEAEALKTKYGIPMDESGQARNIFESLVPALTDLTEQIKKYLNYYQSHAGHEHLPPNGRGVSKIYLCGGGSNLKNLPEFLSLELKIPVELGNPWINILPKPLKQVPELPYAESLRYTTALGLALRGIKEND